MSASAPRSVPTGTRTWPPVAQMGLKPGWWVWLRTSVRWWFGTPWHAQLQGAIETDPAWHLLLARQAMYLRPLIRGYLDRRHPIWTRYAIGVTDFSTASTCFTPEQKAALASGRQSPLLELGEGFSLCLGLNDILPEEGLWALSLRNAQGARVFQMSFSFCPGGRIVVGSIQGGKRCDALDPEQAIRLLTKQCHGLRPQHLLAQALADLALVWRRQSVDFVAPRHQAKSRWHRPARNIRFNYATFFHECDMRRLQEGHWRLPQQLPRKALEDIEARKRALYRRRYAMLDQMATQLAERFSGAAHPWFGHKPPPEPALA